MRKILFRGKDTMSDTWYYGDLEYSRKNGIAKIHTYNENGYYNGQYTVLLDTVGEFTCLLDKNDNKIFEGDVVEWSKDGKKYVVVFRNGMFYASVKEFNEGVYGGYPLWVLCEQEQPCEIVGNIYDNQELCHYD